MSNKNGQQPTGDPLSAVSEELLIGMLAAVQAAKGRISKPYENEVISDPMANKIIIPATMTKLQAAKELKLQHENEEQLINVDKEFTGWNWQDVLVALKKVTEERFGWMNAQTEYGFFGPERPTEIDVIVDIIDGKSVIEKCFFGKFKVSAWEGANSQVAVSRGKVFLRTEAKRKYSNIISEYYNAIEEHLKTNSIFKGKTVVINGRDRFDNINFELIENKGEDMIILNHKEDLVIDTFILPTLREKGKKTYLFTGEYGTGKTETAMRIGRHANHELGMTFFYCKQASLFQEFLNLSKRYQPAIVFLEDLDEIGAGEERDTDMNAILNTLDGVQTKGNDITVIFTTNHENRINPALRRPGRIDLIIRFEYPEEDTKKKIYEALMKGTKGYEDVDFEVVTKETPHVQGAVLAQICKRAKKLALRDGSITTDRMLAAIASMSYQIEFMKEDVEAEDEDKQLVRLLRTSLAEGVTEQLKAAGVIG